MGPAPTDEFDSILELAGLPEKPVKESQLKRAAAAIAQAASPAQAFASMCRKDEWEEEQKNVEFPNPSEKLEKQVNAKLKGLIGPNGVTKIESGPPKTATRAQIKAKEYFDEVENKTAGERILKFCDEAKSSLNKTNLTPADFE